MAGFLRLVGIAGFFFIILAIQGFNDKLLVFQEIELALIALCVLVALAAASIIENQQVLIKLLKGGQPAAAAMPAAKPAPVADAARADEKPARKTRKEAG